MRIATGIIGLMFGLLAMMQSCAVSVGSEMLFDQATAEAGAAGVLIGMLLFLGGAFAFQLPSTAMIIFAIGAGAALVIEDAGRFEDLAMWGWAAAALMVMAFMARREARRQSTGSDGR